MTTLMDKIESVLGDADTARQVADKIIKKYPEYFVDKASKYDSKKKAISQIRAEIGANLSTYTNRFVSNKTVSPHQYCLVKNEQPIPVKVEQPVSVKETKDNFMYEIEGLALRISNQIGHVLTEEATKNAFIMPFINILGYDIFDPTEVIPEFTADSGTKKGEKVDYAIKKNGEVSIIIECKWSGADLSETDFSQLYRYFSVTKAKVAILTNGVVYRFYSDLDDDNKMDSEPFFVFNMFEFQDRQVNELKKFAKERFVISDVIDTASTLKYTKAIRNAIDNELTKPSNQFVKFFTAKVFKGRLTKSTVKRFTTIVTDVLDNWL